MPNLSCSVAYATWYVITMDLIWIDDPNPKRYVSLPWGYLSKRSIVYLNMLYNHVC